MAMAAAPYLLGGMFGNSLVQGNVANKRQQGAQDAATREAKKTADLADQANNKANQKAPNVQGLLSNNAMQGRNGISGTMLTGPNGIDTSALKLGKTTLLGG